MQYESNCEKHSALTDYIYYTHSILAWIGIKEIKSHILCDISYAMYFNVNIT